MASRSTSDLTKEMQQAEIIHKQLCKERGVDLLVYCTLRDNAEQDALYKIGRSEAGKICTNARGGESAHNPDVDGKSNAYDCCPLIAGKPMWEAKHPAWRIVGECGEEAGLSWAGRWTGNMREMPHFQSKKWRKPKRG